jgi:competence protein ComEA
VAASAGRVMTRDELVLHRGTHDVHDGVRYHRGMVVRERVTVSMRLAAMLLGVTVLQVGVMQGAPQKAAAEQPSAEDIAGLQVLDQLCSQCHDRSRVTGELRSADDWSMVIDQMIEIGATGTDEQFDQVLQYLLRHYSKADINRARAAELVNVLGVTPDVAAAIIKQRASAGPFKTLDDLKAVPGVDAAKLEAHKHRIAF